MVAVEEFQDSVQNIIQEYGVDITLYSRTYSYSNITGDETLTSGAGVSHRILWNNPIWAASREKEGEFVGDKSTVITNGSVTINKADLILFAGSMYEVNRSEIKRWQGSGLFVYATAYAMNGS